MKNPLLSAVKSIVYFVVLFFVLSFLGGFTGKQSIVLAVLFYAALSWNSLSTAKKQEFVPFSVFVAPNLYNIVVDFDLVKPTDEGWAEFNAGIEKLSKEHWDIWNNKGFSISFITPELIYNKDRHSFSTEEVDLHASLEPAVIVREKEKPDSMFRNYSPYLNLTSRQDYGCILRLTLLDWHWDKIKDKEILKSIPKSDVSDDRMSGTVDLIIARIPPEEFGVYPVMRGAWDKNDADSYGKAVQARKEARARFGWKGKSRSDMYGNEPGEDRADEAEHRYCAVAHGAI
jgi:hypothetical protein